MSLICTELKHTLGKYQLLCVWIAYDGKKWLKSRNIEFFDFMQVMLPPEWVVTARGLSQPHRKSAGSLSFESEQTHCFTAEKKKKQLGIQFEHVSWWAWVISSHLVWKLSVSKFAVSGYRVHGICVVSSHCRSEWQNSSLWRIVPYWCITAFSRLLKEMDEGPAVLK